MPCCARWKARSPRQVRAVRVTQLLYSRRAAQNSTSASESAPPPLVAAQKSELHLRILHCSVTGEGEEKEIQALEGVGKQCDCGGRREESTDIRRCIR